MSTIGSVSSGATHAMTPKPPPAPPPLGPPPQAAPPGPPTSGHAKPDSAGGSNGSTSVSSTGPGAKLLDISA
jgi:hypothetical protein